MKPSALDDYPEVAPEHWEGVELQNYKFAAYDGAQAQQYRPDQKILPQEPNIQEVHPAVLSPSHPSTWAPPSSTVTQCMPNQSRTQTQTKTPLWMWFALIFMTIAAIVAAAAGGAIANSNAKKVNDWSAKYAALAAQKNSTNSTSSSSTAFSGACSNTTHTTSSGNEYQYNCAESFNGGGDLTMISVASADKCADACDEWTQRFNPKCVGFAFIREAGEESPFTWDAGVCYMKSSLANSSYAANFVAGILQTT